jgi:N-acetylneuraminic acid mutarotase
MSGSSTEGANGGQSGVYGTLGVASAGNVPGARENAVSWTDNSGNFWLFGGQGYDSTGTDGVLNDLWEFTPTTKKWTWISGSNTVNASGVYGTLGVASANSVPGARGSEGTAVSWADGSGNLWLFGGTTGAGYELNDLWEFSPATKEWTWISGSDTISASGVYGTLGVASANNVPGARESAVSWTDTSGNLWLFGGGVFSSVTGNFDELNDLWEFSPATKEWTWVSGSNTGDASGVYGTLGVASTNNVPGARERAVSWTDTSGNLWLYGGSGSDSTEDALLFYDLWEFTPATKEWTWISGGSTGSASVAGYPGVGTGAVSWIDGSGNLWLFGGDGFTAGENLGYLELLNELWEFNPSTKEWTLVWGGNTPCPVGVNCVYYPGTLGVYGTQGVASASNAPGDRTAAVSWTDSSGNFWLFGGYGYDSTGALGQLNDLWRYQP